MNKTFYIFLLFLLFCCEAKTQTEYITNGSFEQIDSCYGAPAPIGFDVFQWAGCKGWSNPIKSSSDLWCQNPKISTIVPPFIPSQAYQLPRTGQNMAGILLGDNGYANYREYVQNKLATPLKSNKNYNIEFYLSKGVMPCTTSRFGVKFFSSQLNDQGTFWLTQLKPDSENNIDNFITDTLGWQKVSMTYRANGTEKFVVIGCFSDSVNLTLEPSGCDTTGSLGYVYGVGYILIDDVSIIEMQTIIPEIPNVFTPNNDGRNDYWHLDFPDKGFLLCTIYNRWGEKVFSSKSPLINWNGKNEAGNDCNDAIYFYIIETEENVLRGSIQLMK